MSFDIYNLPGAIVLGEQVDHAVRKRKALSIRLNQRQRVFIGADALAAGTVTVTLPIENDEETQATKAYATQEENAPQEWWETVEADSTKEQVREVSQAGG